MMIDTIAARNAITSISCINFVLAVSKNTKMLIIITMTLILLYILIGITRITPHTLHFGYFCEKCRICKIYLTKYEGYDIFITPLKRSSTYPMIGLSNNAEPGWANSILF